MAFWGEEDRHYSNDNSSDHIEDDVVDVNAHSDWDEQDLFRHLRDQKLRNLSYTIDLSDFPPRDVKDCYEEVAELKKRKELDKLDKYNHCILELAVNHGDLLMILVLLENGCSHMRCGWENILEERYVQHKWTPLIIAVTEEGLSKDSRLEIVNFLLTFNQDINNYDENHRTAAHWATFRGFPDILQALLVKGADVQQVDSQVESLMGYAINKWTETPPIGIDLVYVLLENHFDVDTTNAYENTPLHLAVLASSREIVVILLQHGAKKWLENGDGDTPIDIARNLGAQNMISLLKYTPLSGG